jgi:hypothetical protein
MPFRQVQISSCCFQLSVPEQKLDGSQILSVLKKMGGKGVSERMWSNMLGDSGIACRFLTGIPDGLARNGLILPISAWKQIVLRPLQAPVLTQSFQQCRAEWNVSAVSTLAVFHVDHHSLAVYMADFELFNFSSPHPGAIKNHQQSTLDEIAGGIDEPGGFLLAQDRWKGSAVFGIREILSEFLFLQSADEKEP